ncbi:MAG TPA: Ldh family oxidoreductase [Candidatus Methylomirabilis sp.]|nr:Ldh family oxidoreductase [Candidatus Methylomirabilis sp.]
MAEKISVSVEKLRWHCQGVLTQVGLRETHAALVAESLLFADLRGVGSHGVVRLSSYLDRVHAGVMQVDPEMKLVRDNPASGLLDACNGFGQIAGARAMDIAIKKAEDSGASIVAVKDSNHFGVAAFYAMRAVAARMIGVVLTNASPAMTPYNAKKRLLGTNPLAVAIPAGSQKPIVLDMSTSMVARGKIRLVAARPGEKIPLGWAVDADGRPTDNPVEALKGSLTPIGGPKGAGLSLIIDLLCGALTGTALTGEVKNITDTSGPSRTGHMFVAINVAKFIDTLTFAQSIDTISQGIKALPSADGTPVYLPGEIEFNLEAKRRVEGIPLAMDVIETLNRLGERHGVGKLSS